MFGRNNKLTLSISSLIFFLLIFCQTAKSEEFQKINEDWSDVVQQRGALDLQNPLTSLPKDSIPTKSSSLTGRPRRLRKKLRHQSQQSSSKIFPSIIKSNKNLQLDDDRLKRFRMLDPEEFQEMLRGFSQLMSYEPPQRTLTSIDNIGEMQLENYWSRK